MKHAMISLVNNPRVGKARCGTVGDRGPTMTVQSPAGACPMGRDGRKSDSLVIASEAKQSRAELPTPWIASSLRSSQ